MICMYMDNILMFTNLVICFAGFDGNVYLFSSDSPSPVFVHEGHVKNGSNDLSKVKVVTHSWHPTENVVLSAATDGSLHAWQQTS